MSRFHEKNAIQPNGQITYLLGLRKKCFHQHSSNTFAAKLGADVHSLNRAHILSDPLHAGDVVSFLMKLRFSRSQSAARWTGRRIFGRGGAVVGDLLTRNTGVLSVLRSRLLATCFAVSNIAH